MEASTSAREEREREREDLKPSEQSRAFIIIIMEERRPCVESVRGRRLMEMLEMMEIL
jgi:hypothetical protein